LDNKQVTYTRFEPSKKPLQTEERYFNADRLSPKWLDSQNTHRETSASTTEEKVFVREVSTNSSTSKTGLCQTTLPSRRERHPWNKLPKSNQTDLEQHITSEAAT
jgi:hypothetical protein